MRVVVLAGGTGGAKLAAGMQELLGDELAVIANTGDDVEHLGVHVSPDPDLVTYWLTGEIDEERGWGIRDDGFGVFERLVELGAPRWFGLSDRDLATCLRRRALIDAGVRPTEAQGEIARALGAAARVLPMCDEPVRTRVQTAEGWSGLQEFLILRHAEPEILGIEFEGLAAASPTNEVADALGTADAIVVGPSNPIISIGPILGVPGMRDLLGSADAPVVAVSPYVGGEVVKGPTHAFMRASGLESSAVGVASLYGSVLDGIVIDAGDPVAANGAADWPEGVEITRIPTLMDSEASRRAVARDVLDFAGTLS